jgi:hypothetical protein
MSLIDPIIPFDFNFIKGSNEEIKDMQKADCLRSLLLLISRSLDISTFISVLAVLGYGAVPYGCLHRC